MECPFTGTVTVWSYLIVFCSTINHFCTTVNKTHFIVLLVCQHCALWLNTRQIFTQIVLFTVYSTKKKYHINIYTSLFLPFHSIKHLAANVFFHLCFVQPTCLHLYWKSGCECVYVWREFVMQNVTDSFVSNCHENISLSVQSRVRCQSESFAH